MDLGCTFPTDEHVPSFLATCKQLGLHTVAFRGLVSVASLKKLEETALRSHQHSLKCLRRADFRLSGDDIIASLARKLTVTEMGRLAATAAASSPSPSSPSSRAGVASSSNAPTRSGRELTFEDADILVLHLDSHSDASVLGDPKFGDLLLASQRETAKRRGPNARVILINVDCFVTASPSPSPAANQQQQKQQHPPSLATLLPAPAKAFALCKSLSKCADVAFELSYLPWVRAHAGSGDLFAVSEAALAAHDRAVQSYEDFLANMSSRGGGPNATTMAPPPPPQPPVPMLTSIRGAAQEIVAAFMKPLILSSGQIHSQPSSSSDANAAPSTIASDLLFMRDQRDIHALAATLTQLRRPLLEQGLAFGRRLAKLEGRGLKPSPTASASAVGDDKKKGKATVGNGKRQREE